MSTPAYVDSETITQADEDQSSRVPVPLPDDPYVAVRQAQLVDTDTESDPEEAPLKAEELQPLGSRVPLMSEEFEVSKTSGTRTVSSYSLVSLDFTAPLSPDHPLTHVSPTTSPTRVSFHYSTVRMAVRTHPTLSPCMSARIAEAAALSPFSFCKSEGDKLGEEDTKEDEEDKSLDADDERESQGLDDEGQGLEDEGLGLEEEEAVPEGQQQAILFVETASSRSVPEQQGAERVSAFRQPTLDTWVDPEAGRDYTNIPAYVLLAAPVQTPPSPEWSFDEDQFIEVGAQLELHESILHDHIQHLDALPPTLVVNINKDVRELYTRLVLALEAWAGHVNTQLADMSQARYDDHRLIHDMLVEHDAMKLML
ncbi:hypothetical protein Tco_0975994 [Tanacetum coccineum]|uniref:Uncharacterized protein n=1 Tax=Tanacetum coccineum TaxID=301880 RepID=A0ABQ5EGE7_9ASTR